jgi:2Fe-2S ferredoxin
MPRLIFKSSNGDKREISVEPGTTVMRAAITHNVDGIVAECGGAAACGTCHVYVDECTLAKLPAPESNEEAMLDYTAEPRAPNSRLSCQLKVTEELDGAVFVIPEKQR